MKSVYNIAFILGLLILSSFIAQNDATTFFNNGVANLKKSDYISAIGDFTNAISMKPDYAEAYYKRAIAKDKLAKEIGFENSELCFDLNSALNYGHQRAADMLKSSCMQECFSIENAFMEPDIVFCADFSSQKQTVLPQNTHTLVNLIKLNFFNNQANSISPSIGQLKHLLYLDLSSNNIKTLPPEIGNLNHLTELHLNKNEINDLPKEMGKLKNLRQIYMRKNNLTKVPETIGNITSLETLDLSFNQLKSLPTGIAALRNNLKELILVGNEIPLSEQARIKNILLPNTTIYFE